MQIPPAAGPDHPRSLVFAVLHRLLDDEPDALCYLRQIVPAGPAAAAQKITSEFRRLFPPHTLNLPAGAVVGSHSFREMGATCAVKAGYSPVLCCDHGFWRQFATLQNHYYYPEFPFSQWMVLLLDFLALR